MTRPDLIAILVAALAITASVAFVLCTHEKVSWVSTCAERKPIDWCEKHWEEMGRVEREAVR